MPAKNPPVLRDFDEPKLEALVELMFLAASADGEFSDEEKQHFLRSIESLTDRAMSRIALDALVERAEASLREVGRAARLSSVRERLADASLRKVALSLVIQVSLADGILRTSERELLLDAAEALEIDRDEAADLVAKLSQ